MTIYKRCVKTPLQVGTAKQLADLTNLEFDEQIAEHVEAINMAGGDSMTFQLGAFAFKRQLDYMHSSAELLADAVAEYMSNPEYVKKEYPDVALVIREVVNNSEISEIHYLPFNCRISWCSWHDSPAYGHG